MNDNYSELFTVLCSSIEEFIQVIKSRKSGLMTGGAWTVKDQLCHIVFWHENYADNYKALEEHRKPTLPEGMSTINMAGVMSLRTCATAKLITRLRIANMSLYGSIVVHKVPRMTYSKGGRTYETAGFLEMITRHINTHTKQVKRAAGRV